MISTRYRAVILLTFVSNVLDCDIKPKTRLILWNVVTSQNQQRCYLMNMYSKRKSIGLLFGRLARWKVYIRHLLLSCAVSNVSVRPTVSPPSFLFVTFFHSHCHFRKIENSRTASLEEMSSVTKREFENFANFGSRICEDLV